MEFINLIKERIEILDKEELIIGKKYGESDDWILVTDTFDKVFIIILKILEHNTGYKDYSTIPLEIGIGIGEYDKWARFDGKNLVIENSTISAFKTNIINCYHSWYKAVTNQSPKSTFILITDSAYRELEFLDREMCSQVEYSRGGRVITFFTGAVDKFQQRGKVLEFLSKIRCPGSKIYDRINEIYVPPTEYNEIKEALGGKRIVLITGTPEFGKTYTAVRLLWEYYIDGYEPKWITGGEETERTEVRKRLENIERELKPKHVIYFEDPFGKIKYESRESLEREIGTIIDRVNQAKDAYV